LVVRVCTYTKAKERIQTNSVVFKICSECTFHTTACITDYDLIQRIILGTQSTITCEKNLITQCRINPQGRHCPYRCGGLPFCKARDGQRGKLFVSSSIKCSDRI